MKVTPSSSFVQRKVVLERGKSRLGRFRGKDVKVSYDSAFDLVTPDSLIFKAPGVNGVYVELETTEEEPENFAHEVKSILDALYMNAPKSVVLDEKTFPDNRTAYDAQLISLLVEYIGLSKAQLPVEPYRVRAQSLAKFEN